VSRAQTAVRCCLHRKAIGAEDDGDEGKQRPVVVDYQDSAAVIENIPLFTQVREDDSIV